MGRFLKRIKKKVKAKLEKFQQLQVDPHEARDIFEEQKRTSTIGRFAKTS